MQDFARFRWQGIGNGFPAAIGTIAGSYCPGRCARGGHYRESHPRGGIHTSQCQQLRRCPDPSYRQSGVRSRRDCGDPGIAADRIGSSIARKRLGLQDRRVRIWGASDGPDHARLGEWCWNQSPRIRETPLAENKGDRGRHCGLPAVRGQIGRYDAAKTPVDLFKSL
jgi:hypothetical protein